MVAAVTLLASERVGLKIDYQVLFYPVTDGGMNTSSYEQFADGPWLTRPAMEWFWKGSPGRPLPHFGSLPSGKYSCA